MPSFLFQLRIAGGVTLAFTACLGLAGCGPSFGNVEGKVTYQGKPLKGGNVTLVSEGGGPSASGIIKEDGTYSVQKVQTGEYKVVVETSSLKPVSAGPVMGRPGGQAGGAKSNPVGDANIPEGYAPSFNPGAAAEKSKAMRYMKIPEKYEKPDTTDLTYTVQSGDQKNDIDLK